MKIIVDNEAVKTNHFIEYLVDNCTEENKSYEYQLVAEDKFDKRFINEKETSLKNKVLVKHSDGFDIFDADIKSDFQKFKSAIEKLIETKVFSDLFKEDNFLSHFIHFKIMVKDSAENQNFEFDFINLEK